MNMAKRQYPWWIKQRNNPQLGTYYVPCGQMSKTAAKGYEDSSLYGYNTMIPFDSEKKYQDELTKLRNSGNKVH